MNPAFWLGQDLALRTILHTAFDVVVVGACIAYVLSRQRAYRIDVLNTYIALVEASPQIVYLSDGAGNGIVVNQGWRDLMGERSSLHLGSGFRDVIHPEDRGEEQRAWERAKREEKTHEHSVRFRVADGSHRWHLIRSIPIRDKRNVVIAWMGTASNIDGQIRASHSMRFLADASEAISTSLDVGDNLSTLARVAAASFADFAAVWLRMPDDSMRLVSLAHVDPNKHLQLERGLLAHPGNQPPYTVKRVLEGRGPFLASDTSILDANAREAWEDIDAQSVIVVPLDGGDHIVGALILTRGDERNRFDAQDVGVAMALSKRAGSAITNARLFEASRTIAKTLQSAFLPPFLPVIEGVTFEAVYRPAAHDAQVGGDWYDVFPLHDGRLALSIGDIMGHGLAAATAMVRIRETIRAAAATLDADPSAVLAFANRALCSSEGDGLATAVFAVYDTHSCRLDYAVAGHPKPLLVRDQQCLELQQCSGMVLGIDPEARCTVGSILLDVGDRIVLYTDGLVECGRDVAVGESHLRRAMCAHESAEAAVDLLLAEGQSDDVALLTMGVSSAVIGEDGRSGWRFHSDDAASATSARTSFASYLSRRGVDEAIIIVAELVFGELVSNVVRHAPGPIDIDVRFDASVPVLTVGDRGRGLRPYSGCARLPEDILSESGRGLFLIERLAGTPHIQPRRGGGSEITVPLTCGATAEELSLV